MSLPDGTGATVEVTMHTDGGRRQVNAASFRSVNAGLRHDWYALVSDQRLLSDYADERSFPVRRVGEMLAAELAVVEREKAETDDLAGIAERCERSIDRKWKWARNELLDQPPLSVSIQRRDRSESGRGG